MPPFKFDPAAERGTTISIRATIHSGPSEVVIVLTQDAGSTQEALALIQHVVMNTGPFRVAEESAG